MRLVWSVTRRFRNLFEIKLTYSSLIYPVTLEPLRKNFKEINVGPKRLFVSAKNSARECLFITPHLSLEPFGKNCKKKPKTNKQIETEKDIIWRKFIGEFLSQFL